MSKELDVIRKYLERYNMTAPDYIRSLQEDNAYLLNDILNLQSLYNDKQLNEKKLQYLFNKEMIHVLRTHE